MCVLDAVWLICHHTCILHITRSAECSQQWAIHFYERAISKTSVYLFRQLVLFCFLPFSLFLSIFRIESHAHSLISRTQVHMFGFLPLESYVLVRLLYVCSNLCIRLILLLASFFFFFGRHSNHIVEKKEYRRNGTIERAMCYCCRFLTFFVDIHLVFSASRADQAIYSMQCVHIIPNLIYWHSKISHFVLLPQYHYYHYTHTESSRVSLLSFFYALRFSDIDSVSFIVVVVVVFFIFFVVKPYYFLVDMPHHTRCYYLIKYVSNVCIIQLNVKIFSFLRSLNSHGRVLEHVSTWLGWELKNIEISIPLIVASFQFSNGLN